MVVAVASAAERQTRLVAVGKGYRKRAQAEEQNQKARKCAPHLKLMLHEDRTLRHLPAIR
jgi:hypothetical protein